MSYYQFSSCDPVSVCPPIPRVSPDTTKKTSEALKGYLAFRHFFSHAYAIELDPARIAPLVEGANSVFKSLQHDIEKMSA